MREYELVLMLDPGQDAPARDAVAQEAKGQIEASGTLKHENVWGLRKLAYEIKQRNEADYRWFRFEAPTELLEQLDHNLKIADGVLRFRIFKVDADTPVMPRRRPPRRARAPRASARPRSPASARAPRQRRSRRPLPRRPLRPRPRLPSPPPRRRARSRPPSRAATGRTASPASRPRSASFCGYSALKGKSRAAPTLRLGSRTTRSEE